MWNCFRYFDKKSSSNAVAHADNVAIKIEIITNQHL